MTNTHIVIVHNPCRDGYGAELTARYYYKLNPTTDNVIYWGTQPNKEYCLEDLKTKSKKLLEQYPDIKVLSIRIFDLAIEPTPLNYLMATFDCVNIEVYDHHLTFKQVWDAYKEADPQMYEAWHDNIHYDVEHSGAYLAWKHYFPDKEVPKIILYIEDRDLWAWRQPFSKEINEALFSTAPSYKEPEKWLEIYFDIPNEAQYFDGLREIGNILLKSKQSRLEQLYRTGTLIEFDNIKVFTCNASHIDASDLGNYAVSQKNENDEYLYDSAFIWRFGYDNMKWNISTRSLQGRDIDVSALCKKYGGGGHKHAAGFEIDIDDIKRLIMSNTL